ncbi:MAG: helix-turn-helix domain-containing protein [Polyangiaceae bacterium]
MTAGLPGRYGRRTRRRILHEAAKLFASRGYADASMNDLAQAAGCSKAAIYYHFADKRQLYEAVLDAALLDGEEAFFSEAEGRPPRSLEDLGERLERVIRRHLEAARRHREATLLRRRVEARAASSPNGAPFVDEVQRLFDLGRQRGLLDASADLEAAVTAVAATCNGHIDSWLFSGQPLAEDVPRRLAALVLHGVVPHESPPDRATAG